MSANEILRHSEECEARKLAQRVKGAVFVLLLFGAGALAIAAKYNRWATQEVVREELNARLGPPARAVVGMSHEQR